MKACPWCAEQIQDSAILCRFCKQPLVAGAPARTSAPEPVRPLGEDPGMRMLLPVGRTPLSIAAGYLGLFSLLLCAAPIALIVSILAVIELKRHPERRGWGRAIFGLVAGLAGTAAMVVLYAKGVLF